MQRDFDVQRDHAWLLGAASRLLAPGGTILFSNNFQKFRLDATTLEFAAGFDHILYISCNPQTLQENVAALQATHAVSAAAVFDQFPYTHHLECGLLLTRR